MLILLSAFFALLVINCPEIKTSLFFYFGQTLSKNAEWDTV